jgi:chromosome segregation ATPase
LLSRARTNFNQLQREKAEAQKQKEELSRQKAEANAVAAKMRQLTEERDEWIGKYNKCKDELKQETDRADACKAELKKETDRGDQEAQRRKDEVSGWKANYNQLEERMKKKLAATQSWGDGRDARLQEEEKRVHIRQAVYGGRDYWPNAVIRERIEERVREGRPVPINNDFFGEDPCPNVPKSGLVQLWTKKGGWQMGNVLEGHEMRFTV